MTDEEKPPGKIDFRDSPDSDAKNRGETGYSEISSGPNSDVESSGTVNAMLADEPVVAKPIVAELVENQLSVPPTKVRYVPGNIHAPLSVDRSLENLSANGGSVGVFVLGVLCVVGSFMTNWSLINGLLGLPLGLWGITSSAKKRTAVIGVVLCAVGIFLCLLHVSEWINLYLNAIDESEPQF